ncbi:BrnT family toxin [Neorhizobium alkalisoli]|uniref:Uncharacterized protein n=1 Tax=Neorhizobium alkalisoli TaxID=528178 RepID=A0A561QVC5_9HYPH|nr:BrnT family toxin [Neorhizobium alkalisoli]TWF54317.1 hypothetical protein FHW37_103181 [Neorhizobium alkalisoli]
MTRFEWNAEKARTNKAKHGVSFELARHIWDDPFHLIVPDTVYDGEERWLAVGAIGPVTILVAAHVYRGNDDNEIIRIISARRATPHERKRYERQAT